jgi:hypothetical protein
MPSFLSSLRRKSKATIKTGAPDPAYANGHSNGMQIHVHLELVGSWIFEYIHHTSNFDIWRHLAAEPQRRRPTSTHSATAAAWRESNQAL